MNYLMYVDKLDARYREVFGKIELYLNNTYVDDGTREEQLSELLDCLLSAQEAGKPVESVVGNDVQKFCESFCSGYDWKNRLLHFLETVHLLAWITLCLVPPQIVAGTKTSVLENISDRETTQSSKLKLSKIL